MHVSLQVHSAERHLHTSATLTLDPWKSTIPHAQPHRHDQLHRGKMVSSEKGFSQDSSAQLRPDLDIFDFPDNFSFKRFLSLSSPSCWCWHRGHTAILQFNYVRSAVQCRQQANKDKNKSLSWGSHQLQFHIHNVLIISHLQCNRDVIWYSFFFFLFFLN